MVIRGHALYAIRFRGRHHHLRHNDAMTLYLHAIVLQFLRIVGGQRIDQRQGVGELCHFSPRLIEIDNQLVPPSGCLGIYLLCLNHQHATLTDVSQRIPLDKQTATLCIFQMVLAFEQHFAACRNLWSFGFFNATYFFAKQDIFQSR